MKAKTEKKKKSPTQSRVKKDCGRKDAGLCACSQYVNREKKEYNASAMCETCLCWSCETLAEASDRKCSKFHPLPREDWREMSLLFEETQPRDELDSDTYF